MTLRPIEQAIRDMLQNGGVPVNPATETETPDDPQPERPEYCRRKMAPGFWCIRTDGHSEPCALIPDEDEFARSDQDLDQALDQALDFQVRGQTALSPTGCMPQALGMPFQLQTVQEMQRQQAIIDSLFQRSEERRIKAEMERNATVKALQTVQADKDGWIIQVKAADQRAAEDREHIEILTNARRAAETKVAQQSFLLENAPMLDAPEVDRVKCIVTKFCYINPTTFAKWPVFVGSVKYDRPEFLTEGRQVKPVGMHTTFILTNLMPVDRILLSNREWENLNQE